MEDAGRSSRNNPEAGRSSLLARACSILANLLLLISPCLLVNEAQPAALASSSADARTESRTLNPNRRNDQLEEPYNLSDASINIGRWLGQQSDDDEEDSTSAINTSEESQLECGEWRKSVKNGVDADANLVDLSGATPTTIARMNRWSPPLEFPANNRIAPYETTTWVVNAVLTEFRRSTDQDYHLNLRDASGKTMIAEIPCPCCIGTSTSITSLITAARSRFDSVFTPTDTFQPANISVRVAGVGMFDFPHEG